ncbi:MAG: transposase [Pseudomonadales bacterium]|nr:transposase [Pseudomonadales bacterium]
MPKPGPRTTHKYSDDFKATAVRLSQLPGVEVQDVAASLYIHPFMLSRWRQPVVDRHRWTRAIRRTSPG